MNWLRWNYSDKGMLMHWRKCQQEWWHAAKLILLLLLHAVATLVTQFILLQNFKHSNSFNPHNNPIKGRSSKSPFYSWGNWETKIFKLSKVARVPASSRAWIWTQAVLLHYQCLSNLAVCTMKLRILLKLGSDSVLVY